LGEVPLRSGAVGAESKNLPLADPRQGT
jgi:hypothetical protein